jgi:hypothetical protein
MKHSCKMNQLAEPRAAGMSPGTTDGVTRRRFLSFFTAGATSLALQACGGGNTGTGSGTTPPVGTAPTPTPVPTPTPTPTPPVAWDTVPTLTFTQGVASSISVAQWLSGASGAAVAISLNSVALPAGVTFNAANLSFDYDGVGAVASTAGHVLMASVG